MSPETFFQLYVSIGDELRSFAALHFYTVVLIPQHSTGQHTRQQDPLNTEAVALSEELQQPEAWLLRLLSHQMLSQRSKFKR